MRRALVMCACAVLALATARAGAHSERVTCSGTGPIEAACSQGFQIGDHGLGGVGAWTTPGFVGTVVVQVSTATGTARTVCTAPAEGGYAPCAASVTGSIKAGQNAVLSGATTASEVGLPPVGRWMAFADA